MKFSGREIVLRSAESQFPTGRNGSSGAGTSVPLIENVLKGQPITVEDLRVGECFCRHSGLQSFIFLLVTGRLLRLLKVRLLLLLLLLIVLLLLLLISFI